MKLPAPRLAALSLTLAFTLHAQTPFTDPANLRGERITSKTGRELPIDQDALGLQQLLRKLQTRASLMLIVAHPDDEDGGMLTFYSRGQGARVATLTLTRGEGGQNAMTGDFEDALGLIRTQELLAADRYFGADQFFGTEVDFGFSKTKAEAFAKWTHQRVLYDAVRAVRLYRPLVIAAVFVGGVTDGHGQHQVSGQIAQEVFKAAADPTVFPELTAEGILPWTPLKVYARVPAFAITEKGLFDYATNQYTEPTFTNYVTGQTSTTPPAPDVIIHEGQPDPLLTNAAANPQDLPPTHADPATKLSYVQFARLGLGLQRTQIGPGVRNAPAGAFDIGYHRYGSRLARQPTHEDTFFDGIDTSLAGIAALSPAPPLTLAEGLQRLQSQLTSAARALNPSDPAALGPALVAAQHDLGALLDRLENTPFPGRPDVLHELRLKQVQLNDAILCALGLHLEANAQTSTPDILPGTVVQVQTTLTSHADEPAGLSSASLETESNRKTEKLLNVDTEIKLTQQKPFNLTLSAEPKLTSAVTRPYFSRKNPEQPVYTLTNPSLRNAPATPAPLTAWVTLRYHETELRIGRVVENNHQALNVVPPAFILMASRAQALAPAQTSALVNFNVSPPGLHVTTDLPKGWTVKAESQSKDALTGSRQLAILPPAENRKPFFLHAVGITPGKSEVTEGFLRIGYPGLPRTNYFTPAVDQIVPIDLKLPTRRRIAYLPGTGDAVADNLRSVGFDVSNLTVFDLTPEHLSRFDTVILGVRTYNAHPDLHGSPTQALLDFARGGGNVIVQYQTGEFTSADAPYGLTLGNAEKVVDETTPVRLLDPQNPGLATPNLITPADFNNWIEERGHGFLSTWDAHYTALTETHDPGVPTEHVAPQLPQKGGLLTTQLGRGHWTYVAFALYRQLPEAVPGAFRLFTNLLALADTKP